MVEELKITPQRGGKPKIGDIKKSRELGYSHKDQGKHIWAACENCGVERWVRIVKGKPDSRLCRLCGVILSRKRGEDNPGWKGGRSKDTDGYIRVLLPYDDFFLPMARKDRRVFEHRLVMAKHLHRCLLPWEVVHHKGTKYPSGSIENKQDNRFENLELLPTQKHHLVDMITKQHIIALEKRVTLLEAENTVLRKQIVALALSIGKNQEGLW